jgi:hypothetical protein
MRVIERGEATGGIVAERAQGDIGVRAGGGGVETECAGELAIEIVAEPDALGRPGAPGLPPVCPICVTESNCESAS